MLSGLNNNFLGYKQLPNQIGIQTQNPTYPLNLRQIDGWDSPKELYINGVKWTLRKDYRDSSGSLPNVMNIQFDDINSGYMKIDELSSDKSSIYLFLYYGTILPKPGSYEKPMNVFFQWFNDKPVQLRKDTISEMDWNRANVYISDYGSLQNATKNALFSVIEEKRNIVQTELLPNIKIGEPLVQSDINVQNIQVPQNIQSPQVPQTQLVAQQDDIVR